MPKELLGDYATRWIDERQRMSRCGPRAQKDCRQVLGAYLMPGFAKKPVDRIACPRRVGLARVPD